MILVGLRQDLPTGQDRTAWRMARKREHISVILVETGIDCALLTHSPVGYIQATIRLVTVPDGAQHLPNAPLSHRYLPQFMDPYQLARQPLADIERTCVG